MKLQSGRIELTFKALQARLLALANAKVKNGEFSERGLAFLLGISQPHLHNVLKGERKLQVLLADSLMEKFQISVTDLIAIDGPERFPGYLRIEEPDPELARLRQLRKRPSTAAVRDRSAWRVG